jgi:hypothetical protein
MFQGHGHCITVLLVELNGIQTRATGIESNYSMEWTRIDSCSKLLDVEKYGKM